MSYEELLRNFEKIPKEINKKTFLEICNYPGGRQEEVASRILRFFLDPNEDHEFGDLCLSSLLECQCMKDFGIEYNPKDIIVEIEVRTSRAEESNYKRLDLLIRGNSFVIGIENKISAELYNPLDIYEAHLKEYPHKKAIGIVLSVKPTKIQQGIFINVLYKEWFEIIRNRLGFSLKNGFDSYAAFLLDFLRTIENKGNIMTESALDTFFMQNRLSADSFVQEYRKFIDRVARRRLEVLEPLRKQLCDATKLDWWIYEREDLGFWKMFGKTKIGIESGFASTDKTFGKFSYMISTWDIASANMVRRKLSIEDRYTELDEDTTHNNRVYWKFKDIDIVNDDFVITIFEKLRKESEWIVKLFQE